MDKGVNEITVDEAAVMFSRSQKQIRRIVDESVHGKLAPDGSYLVAPDPLFAHRVPQAKGYGFYWLINKERMRKHFQDKVDRQMGRIEEARKSSLGHGSPIQEPESVKSNSSAKTENVTGEPVSTSSDTRDIVTVYQGLAETYKKQLEVKDTQLAARDAQISSLIEEVAASKKRSDTLQGALIAIAQGKQLDVQRIQEGEVAIVDDSNQKEPPAKRGWFSGLFGGRN